MRINKLNNTYLSALNGSKADKAADKSSKSPTTESVDAQNTTASYIAKANQLTEVDPAKVAEAKSLIESGQLDTEENVKLAAQNLLNKGI